MSKTQKSSVSHLTEAQKHMLRLMLDFEYCSNALLKVQTTSADLIPFRLNGPQKIVLDIFEQVKQKRPLRAVILKGRRMGMSTLVSGRFYQRTSFFPNRYAMQITHEPQATDFLFRMVKRFYDFSPDQIRPATRSNNQTLLEFNTKDGKGLNSGFRVATSGKSDIGSGQLIHYLHLCMSPDTPVIMADGHEKFIKDIVEGDRLMTHGCNFSQVEHVSTKHSDELPDGGKTVKLTVWNGSPIEMTPQHKVWTQHGWVKAGELVKGVHTLAMPVRAITHSLTAMPINNGRIMNNHNGAAVGMKRSGPDSVFLGREAGYFAGYYLAEGCLNGKTKNGYSRIVFALHSKEAPYAARAAAFAQEWCRSMPVMKMPTANKCELVVSSISLAGWLHSSFGDAHSKHIPDWVFDCGEDFCRGLVEGYLLGDGSKGLGGKHQNYVSNALCASSIRASLTYQIRDLVASLGLGWGRVSYASAHNRHGRNCKPQWTVYFNGMCGYKLRELMGLDRYAIGAKSIQATRYIIKDGFVWLPIKKIESGWLPEVVDIAVAHDDHSFRTRDFISSNSEMAKMEQGNLDSLLTAVSQCVPKDGSVDTEIIYESTAKGIGGIFHDKFWNARYRFWVDKLDANGKAILKESINEKSSKENIETSIFIPWFCFEKNRLNAPEAFVLTQEELEFKTTYNLDNEQMYWRRFTIENECRKSVSLFNQEHPTTPEDAFLGTGNPVFDNEKLLKLKEAVAPPKTRYRCQISSRNWLSEAEGELSVWDEPKPNKRYIIGADVAEGIGIGDFSVAEVIDHATGDQVAEWHGHCDPDEFGTILIALGRRYNTALLVVERNNHGLMTVTTIVNDKYPKIYSEFVPEPPGPPRKRFGWRTDRKTRPLILDGMVKDVREDTHGIVSEGLLEEMMSFKRQDNGNMEADTNRHDDRVIAYSIAKYVRQTVPLPRIAGGEQRYTEISNRSIRKKNALGWT